METKELTPEQLAEEYATNNCNGWTMYKPMLKSAFFAAYNLAQSDKLQALERLRGDIARDMRMIHHDGHNKVNHPTSHTQIGADNIQPDRQSIQQFDLTKYL